MPLLTPIPTKLGDPFATKTNDLAAGGSPDTYRKTNVISGLENASASDLKVFHVDTALTRHMKTSLF